MKRNLLFASCGLILGMTVTQVDLIRGASAYGQDARTVGQRKCDYTYISDNGAPNIGKDGKIEYSDEWKTVLENGWLLNMTVGGQGYIFEKCR